MELTKTLKTQVRTGDSFLCLPENTLAKSSLVFRGFIFLPVLHSPNTQKVLGVRHNVRLFRNFYVELRLYLLYLCYFFKQFPQFQSELQHLVSRNSFSCTPPFPNTDGNHFALK